MAGVEYLSGPEYEYVIEETLKGTAYSAIKAALSHVDGTYMDGREDELNWVALKRRAFSDAYGSVGSDRQWAEVAWAQIAPAPSGALPASLDTEGGEEIIIVGSMFSPGCTATIGGEAITIISQTPGCILGITPPLTAAADNDVVVTSANDNAGTLTPGPATAKRTPVFTSIVPATGPAAGGTTHLIVGTGFAPGMAVTIGGHDCTVLSIQGTTAAYIQVPAHAAGALDIVLTNVNAETVTETEGFTYV